MLPILMYAVLIALALLLVVIARRPSTFTVSRSQTIAAAPAKVFAEIADFRRWAAWSPWEGLDPRMERSYSAVSSGVGASYHWKGDRKVGEGEMTITAVSADQHIGIAIRFLAPFKAENQIEFAVSPGDSGSSTVTWTMSGRNGFLFKAMGLFCNMDKIVGSQFAQGLLNLKRVSEQSG